MNVAAITLRIAAGCGECCVADVNCEIIAIGEFHGKTHGNTAAAGADVK